MIEPMLAKEYDPKWLSDDYYIQPKLDGHRAVWDGDDLYSRNGKLIEGVPELTKILRRYHRDFPLDGEIYAHGMGFDKITSSVRRTVNIQENMELAYHAFDIPVKDLTFTQRYEKLSSRLGKHTDARINLVKTLHCSVAPDPIVFINEGYEGAMYRNSAGLYKFGKRSSDILKYKIMQDAEATVVDLVELVEHEKLIVPKGTPGSKKYADGTYYKNGESTPKNSMGAILCKLDNGKTFEIGSGFDDATRKQIWKDRPIGKVLTFKYQELSKDGIPRFPVFLRWRQDI
jgi:DNA ligase-1